MPILCFAFFYESMIIPVSNAFVVNDSNGAIGMKTSIISLFMSLCLYALILPLMTAIKLNYSNQGNQLMYLAVYQVFDYPFAVPTLILMTVLAIL